MGSTWSSNGGSYNWDIGSSTVGTRAWALRLVVEVTLDAGLELHVWVSRWCWNASFKLCVELRIWDAGLELRVWAPRWCWNTSFKLYRASHLRQGSWASLLGTQWCWNASFKLCIELRVWDAGFKLCVWVLKWSWDVGFDFYVLILQWCRDAGFEPCVFALHEWLWLASRLKHGSCYLMTCL